MYNAKAEEAFTEVELPPYRTTASRREEDQIPLVKNSSRSSTRNGSCHKYFTSSRRKACFIWLAIVVTMVVIALGVGLGFGLIKMHKHEHEHSVYALSFRIPFPGELLLNMIVENPTQPHCTSMGLSLLTFLLLLILIMIRLRQNLLSSLVLVLVAILQALLMSRSVLLSLLLHLLGLIRVHLVGVQCGF